MATIEELESRIAALKAVGLDTSADENALALARAKAAGQQPRLAAQAEAAGGRPLSHKSKVSIPMDKAKAEGGGDFSSPKEPGRYNAVFERIITPDRNPSVRLFVLHTDDADVDPPVTSGLRVDLSKAEWAFLQALKTLGIPYEWEGDVLTYEEPDDPIPCVGVWQKITGGDIRLQRLDRVGTPTGPTRQLIE